MAVDAEAERLRRIKLKAEEEADRLWREERRAEAEVSAPLHRTVSALCSIELPATDPCHISLVSHKQAPSCCLMRSRV